jgi:hypothetical protein
VATDCRLSRASFEPTHGGTAIIEAAAANPVYASNRHRKSCAAVISFDVLELSWTIIGCSELSSGRTNRLGFTRSIINMELPYTKPSDLHFLQASAAHVEPRDCKIEDGKRAYGDCA